MKVLVIGATGGTGQEIVRQAIAAGHQVTALVRHAAAAAVSLPGAVLVEGDARDAASLRRAVAGQDAVADALGASVSGPFKEVTLLSESTRALIAAMQAEGVRRLVCITGIGAGDSRGHGGFVYDNVVQPLLLRGVYADKDRQEALIQASGLEWVIVRPALLSDGDAVGGTLAITDLTHFHGGHITRADTAGFVVAQLASDEWLRQTPLIVHDQSAAAHALQHTAGAKPKVPAAPDVLVRRAGEGHPWQWLEGELRLLALGHEVDDHYTIEVMTTPSGKGPAPHVQSREDEFFFVLEGGPLSFTAGNRTVEVGHNGFINISSGTAHHFKVSGAPARLLCFNAPAGFDRFQLEAAAPWNVPGAEKPPMPEVAERLASVAPAYGIDLHPDPVLFAREPVVHVVQTGRAPDASRAGVRTETLAGPEHTNGRYAAAHVTLEPGARLDQLGHGDVACGFVVLAGQVELDAAGRRDILTSEGFVNLRPGVQGTLVNAGDAEAAILMWHAPAIPAPATPHATVTPAQ